MTTAACAPGAPATGRGRARDDRMRPSRPGAASTRPGRGRARRSWRTRPPATARQPPEPWPADRNAHYRSLTRESRQRATGGHGDFATASRPGRPRTASGSTRTSSGRRARGRDVPLRVRKGALQQCRQGRKGLPLQPRTASLRAGRAICSQKRGSFNDGRSDHQAEHQDERKICRVVRSTSRRDITVPGRAHGTFCPSTARSPPCLRRYLSGSPSAERPHRWRTAPRSPHSCYPSVARHGLAAEVA